MNLAKKQSILLKKQYIWFRKPTEYLFDQRKSIALTNKITLTHKINIIQ